MYEFLAREFTDWDAMDLVEQPAGSVPSTQWGFLRNADYFSERASDSVCYFISLNGTWEDYLLGLDAKVRSNWRNRTKRLFALPGGVQIERVVNASDMRNALDRFISLEQSGWKKQAKLGVAKDSTHRHFYDQLLNQFAQKNQALVFFLKLGSQDIAGAIFFLLRDVLYERHIAYDPAYATYSPGIVLRAEMLRSLFGQGIREMDLLGLRDSGAKQQHKIDWATGKRETVRITIYKKRGRLLPFLLGKKVKHWLERKGE